MDDNAVRNEKKNWITRGDVGLGPKKKMKKNEKFGNFAKSVIKSVTNFCHKCHQLFSQNVTNFFEGGVEVDVKAGAELMSKLMSF